MHQAQIFLTQENSGLILLQSSKTFAITDEAEKHYKNEAIYKQHSQSLIKNTGTVLFLFQLGFLSCTGFPNNKHSLPEKWPPFLALTDSMLTCPDFNPARSTGGLKPGRWVINIIYLALTSSLLTCPDFNLARSTGGLKPGRWVINIISPCSDRLAAHILRLLPVPISRGVEVGEVNHGNIFIRTNK